MKRGFTIIELLVVIAIIALMISLLAFALVASLTNAKEAATKTLIAQLDGVVRARADAIRDADLSREAEDFAIQAGVSQEQAAFLLRKNLFRQALPQSREDLFGLDGAEGTIDDAELLSIVPAGATGSQVFFLALTKEPSVRTRKAVDDGGIPPTILYQSSRSYSVPTLTLDKLPAKAVVENSFVDGWGNPIVFYTWPTRLVRPQTVDPNIHKTEYDLARMLMRSLPAPNANPLPYDDYTHQLNLDASDPKGICAPVFGSSFDVTYATVTLTVLPFTEANYHTPATYSVPLIVSLGPDETLGLHAPTEGGYERLALPLSDPQGLYDNLTNLQ